MANPGGGNQFGNFELQPKYGDVKKQSQLLKAAPISGAPTAINAPRRDQKAAQRRPQPQAAEQAPPPMQPPPPAPQVLYQQIAQIPGVTPMWSTLLG